MKSTKLFKEQLKSSLEMKANEIDVKDSMFAKIKYEINEREREIKMSKSFKNNKMKKVVLAGVIGVFSISCVAAPIIKPVITSWMGTSSSKSTFNKFPNEEEVQKAVGFSPKYVETLPNGFTFDSAYISDGYGQDEKGNKVVSTKSIVFDYQRAGEVQDKNSKMLILSIEDVPEEFVDYGDAEEVNCGELKLYYNEQLVKNVPPEYELTEEDEINKASGKVEFNYGTAEVEEIKRTSVVWYENGLEYVLINGDYDLTKDQLLDMSKTVINK